MLRCPKCNSDSRLTFREGCCGVSPNKWHNLDNIMLTKTINLSPIDGEIDKLISGLVDKMRKCGFDTISSCEGHLRPDNFRHVRPNVIFRTSDRGLLHAWVREISKLFMSVELYMFPVWDTERDIVHEDNWIIWLDLSSCNELMEAETYRNQLIKELIITLDKAKNNLPLETDYNRSIWCH